MCPVLKLRINGKQIKRLHFNQVPFEQNQCQTIKKIFSTNIKWIYFLQNCRSAEISQENTGCVIFTPVYYFYQLSKFSRLKHCCAVLWVDSAITYTSDMQVPRNMSTNNKRIMFTLTTRGRLSADILSADSIGWVSTDSVGRCTCQQSADTAVGIVSVE